MLIDNMLSLCVLIAALATGNCFYSNLMNEPLKLAVSLLDGQSGTSRSSNAPKTTPNPTSSEESLDFVIGGAGYVTTRPKLQRANSKSRYEEVIAKKVAFMRDGDSSMKRKLQKIRPKVTRLDSEESARTTVTTDDVSGSTEILYMNGKSRNSWKRPASTYRFESGDSSQSMSIEDSTGKPENYYSRREYNRWSTAPVRKVDNRVWKGDSTKARVVARVSPIKTDIKMTGWRKGNWMVSRSGSDERIQSVTVKPLRDVRGGKKDIIFVHKTAIPIRGILKNRLFKKSYNYRPQEKREENFDNDRSCDIC